MADPDYGFTFAALGLDIDPAFTPVVGAAAVAQDLADRLCTPEASLFYDPDYECIDLSAYLSKGIDAAEVYRLQAKVARALRQDERVDDVEISVDFNPTARTLTVSAEGTGALGPFRLVVAASQAAVAILEASAL